MKYVFDTSAFVVLFRNYYQGRFPTLWKKFDRLIKSGRIISTREVKREIKDQVDGLSKWADSVSIFPAPTAKVAGYVSNLFLVKHFQGNVGLGKMLRGGKVADPFVVAMAASLSPEHGAVVTLEKRKPNAPMIPNMCDHFGIRCMDLEGFMEEEGWKF